MAMSKKNYSLKHEFLKFDRRRQLSYNNITTTLISILNHWEMDNLKGIIIIIKKKIKIIIKNHNNNNYYYNSN
jgi:hypothetical protein